MRSAPWLALAAALALAACRDDEPRNPDHDGDGTPETHDCNDWDPAVHATVRAFPDSDGDGVGAGDGLTFCTGGALPAGHAATGGDCAPLDASAWRLLHHVDADGDGFTAAAASPLCTGAALPEPYRAAASGNDCDDADAVRFAWTVVYRDQDGDGVGAPPRSIPCLGAALPAGFSRLGFDVDDADGWVSAAPAADDLARLLD